VTPDQTTEQRLSECIAAVFPELLPDELPRAGSASMPNWDSLAMVTLVSLVEEEFGISFPPDDYAYAASYALLLDYLRSRLDE
jgi:acyl carrier protein